VVGRSPELRARELSGVVEVEGGCADEEGPPRRATGEEDEGRCWAAERGSRGHASEESMTRGWGGARAAVPARRAPTRAVATSA